MRVEDLELVLVTHHHLDHSGLASTIARGLGCARSARSTGRPPTASATTSAPRRTGASPSALMRHHGVPDAVIAANEGFFDFIRARVGRLAHRPRALRRRQLRAGGRDLRVVARPGHSTTDTLFVDDTDARRVRRRPPARRPSRRTPRSIPAVEPDGTRPRARVEYLESLQRTAAMPLARLLTGHGDPIDDHAQLVEQRLRRAPPPLRPHPRGPPRGRASAYEITTHLWSPRTVSEQPLLVVWEVLGHLDLLLDAGNRQRAHHRRTDPSTASRTSPSATTTVIPSCQEVAPLSTSTDTPTAIRPAEDDAGPVRPERARGRGHRWHPRSRPRDGARLRAVRRRGRRREPQAGRL